MVIDDPDPDLLAAHALLTTGAHGIGGDWFNTYLDRGFTRAGLTAGQAGYFFEEFTDIARWFKFGGAASLAALTTVSGGVGQIAPGVGDAVQYRTGNALFDSPTVAVGNGRFYLATRVRFSAGVPADGLGTAGLINGFVGVMVGAFGGASLVNYVGIVLGGAGLLLNSTIALDANWHNFEMWCDGSTTYYFSVDNETPVSGVLGGAPFVNLLYPNIQVTSGAGVAVTGDFDKYLAVFPQAA
jgi:hypothetical protein